jgi:hypothetical protein
MIMWTGASDLYSMSDAELDDWKQDGVGGFVGSVAWLNGMGGNQVFTGSGTGPAGGVESQLASSDIVARAHALGMKLYLGFNLVNFYNTQTPLGEWFNNAEWDDVVLPAVSGLAGAARELGFDGIAMDGELYLQQGNAETASWSWDYPGNTHTEQAVRAEVTQRGRQMMTAILAAFPGVQIADYHASFPDTWDAYAEEQNGDGTDVYASNVDINFWDGMTSVSGYSAIRFYDEMFSKDTGVSGGTAQTWSSALGYEANSLFALLSRAFSNWSYAADRVYLSPSAWIDGDETNQGSWTAPRDPSYVETQLQAFHNWGMGGEFADYAYAPLGSFDYSPYVSAMQAAAEPTPVNDPAPVLTVSAVQIQGQTAIVSGTASDAYAVRVVRWAMPGGATGTAQVTWDITNGSYESGYVSQSDWTADIPLAPGSAVATITAENIHGVTATTGVPLPSFGFTGVSVGSDGALWALGANPVGGGYGIYRQVGNGRQGVPGGAVAIGVGPTGSPWVVNSGHKIFQWTGAGWAPVAGGAIDVSVGSDGAVWVVGTNPVAGGYGIYRRVGDGWQGVAGGAVAIGVGPSGSPWVVNSGHAIFQWTGAGWISAAAG